jgi:hypothetical protein
MMKIFDLEEELKKIIEENVKEYKLNVHPKSENESEPRAPIVIIGNQPREVLQNIIPCVIIKTPAGKNTLLEKLLTLAIGVVIYETETSTAYKIIYEIIEKISTAIIEKGVILQEFEILPTYEWNISDEEMYPFWAGNLNFHIVTKNIYRTDVDDFIYGKDWGKNGE